MPRCYCCDRPIQVHHSLCQDCLNTYAGNSRDKSKWPEWLRFLVTDKRREEDYDRNHPHISPPDNLLYG
jgi:hypothetical protein